MKSTKKGKRVPVNNIPEVQRLTNLKTELEQFKTQHADVFMQYKDLVDQYNAALEEADKEVRSQGVSCGDFDNYSVSAKYIPQKMFEELGEDLFLKCGGSMSTKTEYKVDPKLAEAAIASKLIPEECVDNIREIRRNYHAPDKISL